MLKIKPPIAFFMCFTSYIALFLLLSLFVSYQSAMESAVMTQGREPAVLPHSLVIIDPGHGGMDGGAVGITGTYEKDLNLQVALKLEKVLNLFGVAADMTRNTDVTLGSGGDTIAKKKAEDMRTRLRIINETPYELLFSIHMNSYPEEKYWGSQVFYAGGTAIAKGYGESIQKSLRTFVASDNKREAKRASDEIYLMKHAVCPALIIECGFLSNYREEALLQTQEHQIKLACAIASGFLLCRQGSFDVKSGISLP